MAKGVAAITMDEEYQQKRREAMNKQPSGLRDGLTRGGKGLVSVCKTHCLHFNHKANLFCLLATDILIHILTFAVFFRGLSVESQGLLPNPLKVC